MARKPKKVTSVKVNFKDVESRRTPAEGDYALKVLEAEKGESSKGNDQITVISEITAGEYKGSKLYQYFPLSEQSLWRLHGFLTALGEEVPEDEMEVDLEEMVDKEYMGVVAHETYKGKKQARIVDVDVIEAYDGEKDDDKKSKGKKDKSKKDEKSDAKDDKSGKKDKSKKDKSKKDEPAADEGKKGKKDKGSKKDKVEKYDEDDIKALDKKGLKAIIKKHDLTVDLDDFKTDKKAAAAVLSELEDADLIG